MKSTFDCSDYQQNQSNCVRMVNLSMNCGHGFDSRLVHHRRMANSDDSASLKFAPAYDDKRPHAMAAPAS